MKKTVVSIIILFFLVGCLAGSGCGVSNPRYLGAPYPPLDTIIPYHTSEFIKAMYPKRIKDFMSDPVAKGDIVMLGNSLTQSGRNWSERLGVANVKNRGIAGDNTEGALARLNEIIYGKPSIVFVMIGTNDLWTDYSAEKIVQNIDRIGTILAKNLPHARIYVETLMPLKAGHTGEVKLKEVNLLLRKIHKSKYTIIDTNREMANEEGALADDLTTDGVHLTPKGYEKWCNFLETFLPANK